MGLKLTAGSLERQRLWGKWIRERWQPLAGSTRASKLVGPLCAQITRAARLWPDRMRACFSRPNYFVKSTSKQNAAATKKKNAQRHVPGPATNMPDRITFLLQRRVEHSEPTCTRYWRAASWANRDCETEWTLDPLAHLAQGRRNPSRHPSSPCHRIPWRTMRHGYEVPKLLAPK
jgi:hypothetical protein